MQNYIDHCVGRHKSKRRINVPKIFCEDIHPFYTEYEKSSPEILQKWYESDKSTNYILRRQAFIKCIVILDVLNNELHLKDRLTNKQIDFIHKTIIENTPFITVEDFKQYVQRIMIGQYLADPYVDLVYGTILTMVNFKRWLGDNNYKIRKG